MAFKSFFTLFLIHICLFVSLCYAEDPTSRQEFEVSYITASPLGVPQQVWFSCSLSLVHFFIFSATVLVLGLLSIHE